MASGLAETAKLVSSLELDTRKFDSGVTKASGSLRKLESTSFKVGQNIGKGLSTAAGNLKKIAIGGGIALAGAVAFGVRSLADLQRSQAQTAAVIKSTGGAAGVSAQQVRDLAEAQENLTTVDDKVIQDGENLLLTFTGIGKQVFPQATKAMVDLGVAMAGGNVEQVDLKASAIQLGKALNDPVKGITALTRVGVSFSKEQQKQIKNAVKHGNVLKAQKLILSELNKEFGKAGEAAGKGPEAVWRRLQDAGEDLSQVLARGVLPALERVGAFLTEKLQDKAFLAQVDEFGQRLGVAVDGFLAFIQTVDFPAIGRALSVAADAAGTLVGWFLKMPAWVQTAVITGWGLNKLTGGMLTDIFGTLASGLIKGVLGMNAGVVNINAGVVNGGPGGPGIPGGPGTIASLISTVLGPLGWLGAAMAVGGKELADSFNANLRTQGIEANFKFPGGFGTGVFDSLGNIAQGIKVIQQWLSRPTTTGNIDRPSTVGPAAEAQRKAIEQVETSVETMKGKIADELNTNKTAIDGAASASTRAGSVVGNAVSSAASRIVSAIAPPIVTTDVRVYVTAAGVSKSVNQQTRYGKANGSDGGGGGDSGVSPSDL